MVEKLVVVKDVLTTTRLRDNQTPTEVFPQ